MKLTGCTDLALDHTQGGTAVVMTLQFQTPMQAREAFEMLRWQTEQDHLTLRLTLGDQIVEH